VQSQAFKGSTGASRERKRRSRSARAAAQACGPVAIVTEWNGFGGFFAGTGVVSGSPRPNKARARLNIPVANSMPPTKADHSLVPRGSLEA